MDCQATEQRRFQPHAWVCEAGSRSVFRHAKVRRRRRLFASGGRNRQATFFVKDVENFSVLHLYRCCDPFIKEASSL